MSQSKLELKYSKLERRAGKRAMQASYSTFWITLAGSLADVLRLVGEDHVTSL